MFEKIIQTIKDGKISTIEKIAESIGTSPVTTRLMIEDLVRMEYLREVSWNSDNTGKSDCNGCAGNCSCCPIAMKSWEVTDKAYIMKTPCDYS